MGIILSGAFIPTCTGKFTNNTAFTSTGNTGKQEEGLGLDGGDIWTIGRAFIVVSTIYAIVRLYGITIKRLIV